MKAFAASMLSYVSVPGDLEDWSASNLLCKLEKREALERAGHKAERMIVVESVQGRESMLRVIMKRNCIAQDSGPFRGLNLGGYRANVWANPEMKGSAVPSCCLKNFEQSFPYSKIFEMSILSMVNFRVSMKAISKSLARLKSCSKMMYGSRIASSLQQ